LLTNGIDVHQSTKRVNKNSPSWEPEYLYSYEKILHSKYNTQNCEESIAVVIMVTARTDAAGWLQAAAHLFLNKSKS